MSGAGRGARSAGIVNLDKADTSLVVEAWRADSTGTQRRFVPDEDGDRIIPLALAILENRPVPPAVFVDHQVITRATHPSSGEQRRG